MYCHLSEFVSRHPQQVSSETAAGACIVTWIPMDMHGSFKDIPKVSGMGMCMENLRICFKIYLRQSEFPWISMDIHGLPLIVLINFGIGESHLVLLSQMGTFLIFRRRLQGGWPWVQISSAIPYIFPILVVLGSDLRKSWESIYTHLCCFVFYC